MHTSYRETLDFKTFKKNFFQLPYDHLPQHLNGRGKSFSGLVSCFWKKTKVSYFEGICHIPWRCYIYRSGNMFYTMAVWVTTGWSACPIPLLCEISSQSRLVLCRVEDTTYPESHERFKDCHPPKPITQQNCHMDSDCAASNISSVSNVSNVSNVLPPPCRVECRMTETGNGDGCCEINNYAIIFITLVTFILFLALIYFVYEMSMCYSNTNNSELKYVLPDTQTRRKWSEVRNYRVSPLEKERREKLSA